jgi:hypothetical protein
MIDFIVCTHPYCYVWNPHTHSDNTGTIVITNTTKGL